MIFRTACSGGDTHWKCGKPQLTDWFDPVLVETLVPGSEQVSESRESECDVLSTILAELEVAEELHVPQGRSSS